MITVETKDTRGHASSKDFYSARGAWNMLQRKWLFRPDGNAVTCAQFLRMFGEGVDRNAGDFTNKFGDKIFIKKC